jgi:hypothetical protein
MKKLQDAVRLKNKANTLILINVLVAEKRVGQAGERAGQQMTYYS